MLTSDALPEGFDFVSPLGEGSTSVVFKALHKTSDRLVAIKIYTGAHNNVSLERFRREAQILAGLDHPAIQKVLRFGLMEESTPFIVNELLEGYTLASLLDRVKKLTSVQFREIFPPLCDALIYMHSKGIAHRDIKPSNIFLCEYDGILTPRFMDFGLAKEYSAINQGLTQTGQLLGTPLYMSPEQCSGSAVGTQSDIFSLGCVMYECLTGESPWSGENGLELMSRKLSTAPNDLCSYPKLPKRLSALVMKTISKSPEQRPDALTVRRALEERAEWESADQGRQERTNLRTVILAAVAIVLLPLVISVSFLATRALTPKLVIVSDGSRLNELVLIDKRLYLARGMNQELLKGAVIQAEGEALALLSRIDCAAGSQPATAPARSLLFNVYRKLADMELLKYRLFNEPINNHLTGAFWQTALNIAKTSDGKFFPQAGLAERGLGEWSEANGRPTDAERHYRHALELYPPISQHGEKHLTLFHDEQLDTNRLVFKIGSCEVARNDRLGISTIERAWKHHYGPHNQDSCAAIVGMAQFYKRCGRLDEYEKTMSLLEKQARESIPDHRFVSFLSMASACRNAGDFRRSEKECVSAMDMINESYMSTEYLVGLCSCAIFVMKPGSPDWNRAAELDLTRLELAADWLGIKTRAKEFLVKLTSVSQTREIRQSLLFIHSELALAFTKAEGPHSAAARSNALVALRLWQSADIQHARCVGSAARILRVFSAEGDVQHSKLLADSLCTLAPPLRCEVYGLLGIAQFEGKDLHAISTLRQALRLCPSAHASTRAMAPQCLDSLIKVEIAAGLFEEAKKDAQEFDSLPDCDNSAADTLIVLGGAAADLGKFSLADRYFNEAYQISSAAPNPVSSSKRPPSTDSIATKDSFCGSSPGAMERRKRQRTIADSRVERSTRHIQPAVSQSSTGNSSEFATSVRRQRLDWCRRFIAQTRRLQVHMGHGPHITSEAEFNTILGLVKEYNDLPSLFPSFPGRLIGKEIFAPLLADEVICAGTSYYQRHRYLEVLSLLEKALQMDFIPRSDRKARIVVIIAAAYWRLGKFDQSKLWFSKIEGDTGESGEALRAELTEEGRKPDAVFAREMLNILTSRPASKP